MPTLQTYTFKHILNSSITVTIQIYGDSDDATLILERIVKNSEDWELQ